MEFLIPVVKIIHIAVSLLLVLIILLQPSKSGDIGSMFGGGTSESVFGSSGAVPFLVKMTRLLGVIFVVTSLSLGYFSVRSIKDSVVKDPPASQAVEQSPSEETAQETSSEEPEEEKSPEPDPAGSEREPGEKIDPASPEGRSSGKIAPAEKPDAPAEGAEKQ